MEKSNHTNIVRLTAGKSPMRAFLSSLIVAVLLLSLGRWGLLAQEKTGEPVGPGVVHRHVYLPERPWAIHILEVDLSDSLISVETVKARDRLKGLERTSEMARRRDWEGHRVVGAVNGDFYAAEGVPTGLQVSAGVLVHEPNHRTVFATLVSGQPLLARVRLEAEVWIDGRPVVVHGVNRTRRTDELVLYNFYQGASTGTNRFGAEATLLPIDPILVNQPVRCVVLAVDSVHGNQPLSDTTWVLSGHGLSRDLVARKVEPGDTLQVDLNLPPVIRPLREAVAGLPRIVRGGAVSVETDVDGGENFARVRHPRTAVGLSADSTRLWLVTVDGRQPGYSDGMTLFELAEFMVDLGVGDAVNLDGGGSTTMVVRGEVRNRPSDAQGERSVSNALLVISRAPTGPLTHLRLSPHRVELFAGESVQFAATGTDAFYNPVNLSAVSLIWDADPQIGTIGPDGLFTSSTRHDSGYVRVSAGAGGMSDSAFVLVHVLSRLAIEPDPVILRPGERQPMKAYGIDTGRRRIDLTPDEVVWRVIGTIGDIGPDAVFTAADSGRGWIEARIDTLSARVEVRVGGGGKAKIDRFDNLLNWRLDGSGVRLTETSFELTPEPVVSPPTAARLHYALIRSGGTSVFYLERDLLISGTPDSLSLFVLGDDRPYLLTGEFRDRDEELFEITFDPGQVPLAGGWREVAAGVADARANWRNLGAHMDPPFRWHRFLVYPRGGAIGERIEGTLAIDDFSATYVTRPATSVGAGSTPPELPLGLYPSFPNPFNTSTLISYSLARDSDVSLIIFDVSGKQVRHLISEPQKAGTHQCRWRGDDDRGQPASSGLYFCRLSAQGKSTVRRLVLLR